jgi:adenine deaminase
MKAPNFKLAGQIVDIPNRDIYPGEVEVVDGHIAHINRLESAPEQYIMPGFVDAHIHIESSLLVPSEFARLATVFGTVATVSDPHEIGNVLGVDGVKYMIENGEQVNFKFFFGAPSCVPATPFETAGAEIDLAGVTELLQDPRVKYLAEMMNWPGVLHGDEVVKAKIQAAEAVGKPVDGHAPGLKGADAKAYIEAGMSTDHECFTADEAQDKLNYGMKVLIREGSAARNFEALIPLLDEHYENMMFCSDDMHPDNLILGHINQLAKRAVAKDVDVFKVLQAACINPVKHYKLDVGLLNIGDPADFIILDSLKDFNVLETYINGIKVAEQGKDLIKRVDNKVINKFTTSAKNPEAFLVKADGDWLNVIEALDGELITHRLVEPVNIVDGYAVSNVDTDVLKLAVINRYEDVAPAVAFIKNFGLKSGAIASSVGHDSHNITVVGIDDASIARAVNLIIQAKGGLSAVNGEEELLLELPVAGLMSPQDGYVVAEKYTVLDQMAKSMGSELRAPFMTLSFMALLVIPSIKLSDKGLFDGDQFKFLSLFETPPSQA